MEPWNTRTGYGDGALQYPVQKFTTAGVESVPPAPWVKIKIGEVVEEDGVY